MDNSNEWDVILEGQLLDAMVGHKPVGVNKYFQMAFICDKFADSANKSMDSDKIWTHLATMYNLDALDESEAIPFPNSERDFELPDNEFGTLMLKKEDDPTGKFVQNVKTAGGATSNASSGGRDTPKIKDSVQQGKRDEKSALNRNATPQRRDSKDSKESKNSSSSKKEVNKKDGESKIKGGGKSGRNSVNSGGKEEKGTKNSKVGEDGVTKQTPAKRPTRGSLKPNDDSGSSGKSSPITVTPSSGKRRRI